MMKIIEPKNYRQVLYLGNEEGYADPRKDPIFAESVAFCAAFGFTGFHILCEHTDDGKDTFKSIVQKTLRHKREHPDDDVYIAMPRYERFIDSLEDIEMLVENGVTIIAIEVPTHARYHARERGIPLPAGSKGDDIPFRYYALTSRGRSPITSLWV